MRCLYCGKELALLKRWTGGGDFCSDAHRQQYQDEYNQLALTRLLQAKPQLESKPAETPKSEKSARPTEIPKVETPRVEVPRPEMVPAMASSKLAEPVYSGAIATAPEPIHEDRVDDALIDDEPGPADPIGFLIELPVPLMAEVVAIVESGADFDLTVAPSLPHRIFNPWETEVPMAAPIVFHPHGRILDYASRRGERGPESRDFVRSAPIVQLDLHGAREVGLFETAENTMDLLVVPQPPRESPSLWMEPERAFVFETETGELIRSVFGTTGMPDPSESYTSTENLATKVESPAVQPVEAAAPPAQNVEPAAFKSEPPVKMSTNIAPLTASIPVETASVEEVALVVEPAVSEPVEEPQPERVPLLVTKPLPVTLHGLAAGRGKPIQVFPSAVSTGVDLQVPRATGLPLRPLMVLGPAEPKIETKPEKKSSERTVLVRPDPKRPALRPDPRFANTKNRKIEPEPRENPQPPIEKVVEKVVERVAEKAIEKKAPEKQDATAAVKEPPVEKMPEAVKPAEAAKPPVVEPAIETKAVEPKIPVKENKQPSFPAPLSAPYEPPDLGLPSLNLKTSDGFFSRLPVVGKIGLLLLIAVMIGGGIYVLTHSGGTNANGPQIMEAGPSLTVGEGGWITDWAAEPGVKRQHEISVLKQSLNMSDYRVQFQAQIETKALGWVYRAKDGKNYYVNRLEIVKPGLQPVVSLVRFAVINGEEQPRSQFPLTIPLRIDTLYKIRFDAVGDKFTTYVQDQKVDEWTDSRIHSGGVGLYNEWGERMSLKGSLSVVPLVVKK